MSKLFFKGRIDVRQNHVKSGYNVDRNVKLGSEAKPLTLTVASSERETEIATLLLEHELTANITVDADKAEDITELEGILNRPKSVKVDVKPKRNEPCPCGSQKKYKACCA